jgi:hypothetical protein
MSKSLVEKCPGAGGSMPNANGKACGPAAAFMIKTKAAIKLMKFAVLCHVACRQHRDVCAPRSRSHTSAPHLPDLARHVPERALSGVGNV